MWHKMLKSTRKKFNFSPCSLEGVTLIIAYIQAILYALTLVSLLGAIVYLKHAINKDKHFEITPSFSFFSKLRDHFFDLGYHVLDLLLCVTLTILFLLHLTFDVLLILGIQSRKTVLIIVYFTFGFIVNAGGIITCVMLFICGYYKLALPGGFIFAVYSIVLTLVWITYRRIETDEEPVNAVLEIVEDKCHPKSVSVVDDLSHWWWGPRSKKDNTAMTH